MVVAETIKNQIQETFEEAGGKENGPELSRRIGWFSEVVDGMIVEDFQRQNKCNMTRTSWRESYCWAEERRWERCRNAI